MLPELRLTSLLGLLLAVAMAAGGAAYFYLTGIRWQEAYRAMGVVDGGPHALAQAMAEDEPPDGLPMSKRLHPAGTLMRLRYEEVNQTGTPVASYELRALVPPLPYFGRQAPGSELGALACREPCRQELERGGAVLIERSGKAGLADEWLLRMPAGQRFSLGRRDISVQDIGEEQPRIVARTRLRVTVLEACKASVRIGAAAHVEYFPLPIPIPRAVRTTQWVQLEGCVAMMRQAPTQAQLGPPLTPPAPPPQFRRAWQDRADWEAVRPANGGPLGWATLMVDEDWLARNGQSRAFHLLRACQFDNKTGQWLPLPRPEGDGDIALRAEPSPTERIAYHFPKESALFFAEWTEIVQGIAGNQHHIVMPSGRDTCQVTPLPVPAAGEVVACVPSGMISHTALVPDPRVRCEVGPDPIPAQP